MNAELRSSFRFEAAHRLPNVPADHRCARLHGHSYVIELRLSGPVDPELGWVVDFATVAESFTPIRRRLDHRCLNDISGLENPTAENLAAWIYRELAEAPFDLDAVVVSETPETSAIFRG